jgi:hypothetical protein
MVVESWGESANSLQQIANGLQDHGVKVVKFGFSAYQGATLQGEIRELCSQQIQLRNDFLLSDLRSECAPAYFARMGYRVLGMHGYKKEFYSRDLIWEKLGTAERYFDSDLKSLKRCAGPFSGVCDTNLIRYGTHLASGPEKTFLYLMTLSSHEPLPSPEVDADARYFADIETVTTTQVVARNAIASLVAELDSNSHGPCTLAYVVGDHQPPSRRTKCRSSQFRSTAARRSQYPGEGLNISHGGRAYCPTWANITDAGSAGVRFSSFFRSVT